MKMNIDLEQLQKMRQQRSLDMETINYYFHSPLDAINFLIDQVEDVETDKIDDLKDEIKSLEEVIIDLEDQVSDLQYDLRDLEKEIGTLRGEE